MGDPLHSAPIIFSYGCSASLNADGSCPTGKDRQYAIMGTNEGFVHLFDTNTGMEQFAFMPGALLKNIKRLKTNEKIPAGQGHPYGMDNTVTVWVEKEKDGTLKHVYAYATMRRGGDKIYALDITNPQKPRLLWQVSNTMSEYKNLGQTWSQPVKTKIDWDGKITDVLIFSGSYDDTQDDADSYRKSAKYGNDLYIVRADTGRVLWSASTDLNLANIDYSIPGQVKVIHRDENGNLTKDGTATQIFFGDTGGQVWRLFINTGKGFASKAGLITAAGDKGIIFRTHGSGVVNERRFYHAPDVVFMGGGIKPRLFVKGLY